jgi:GTP-binding protein
VALDDERRFVAADLPGLIEDAHLGRGLGLQFLRHVERTRVLAFLIDVTSADPAAELQLLEREVSLYSRALMDKPRVVVLTKADLLPADELAGAARTRGLPEAHVISAHSGEGLGGLLEELWRLIATGLGNEISTHG